VKEILRSSKLEKANRKNNEDSRRSKNPEASLSLIVLVDVHFRLASFPPVSDPFNLHGQYGPTIGSPPLMDGDWVSSLQSDGGVTGVVSQYYHITLIVTGLAALLASHVVLLFHVSIRSRLGLFAINLPTPSISREPSYMSRPLR
jgi:hypothetical protein